ncbi:lysozyme inhibitor LprI family protein [Delftia acidovorans]|uniref:lysozyme inhibitor LprI family protein n=1 Tax=Delftia acidovorans TaxID=80866 RepID=UPI0028A735E9|nr:lysozyme inhibitor LprI family protein [Delftia acidovorans]
MRTKKLTTLALAACIPLWSLATEIIPQPDERALREECIAHSQAGMRDCLARRLADSHKALKQAEEQAASALGQWDEDAKYAAQAKARLSASGKEFTQYRDAQCSWLASLAGGAAGNATEIRRLSCAAALNFGRAAQVRDATSELPLK